MNNTAVGASDRKQRQERFLQLLLPVRNQLFRFAVALLRNHDDAMDLTSETILIALERYDEQRPESGFKAYLFTIATRLCRRMTMRRKWFVPLQPEDVDSIADTKTPPDVAHDIAALRIALAQLPARQREAITLFELAGLSLKEVQQVQGGSLSGVKSRIARGRQQLAELLGAATRETTDDTASPSNQQAKGQPCEVVTTMPPLSSIQPSRTHE